MVRSLWSGASGMNAQQVNIDTIANNLSNVNSTGYKAQGAQFKSLLYQTLQSPATTANGEPKPTNSQVGLGVRTASINGFFSQGSLLSNDSNTALAIEGDGFFGYHDASGNIRYTRNGDFTWALGNADGSQLVLTNHDGNPVLNTEGQEIRVDGNRIASKLNVGLDGTIVYMGNDGPENVGHTVGLWQFNNRGGLERVGDTAFAESAASGPALNENTNQNVTRSKIVTGYLEGSNVNIATEMVNMIVAQRAYEVNSKSITTTDEMMQTANQLKR